MGLFSKKHKKSYYDYAYINEENTGYPMLDDEGILPIGQRSDLNFAPHALTADEVKGNEPVTPVTEIPMESAGESLYKRMMDARREEEKDEADIKAKEVKKEAESLLSRCSQYTEGQSPTEDSEPLYILDSIEDIIAEAEKRAEQRVNNIYNKKTEIKASAEPFVAPAAEETRETVSHSYDLPKKEEITEAVEGLRLPDEKVEVSPDEDIIPTENTQEEIEKTQVINLTEETETITMVHETEVKNYQYRFADEEIDEPETADESTMPFTALTDDSLSSYMEDIKSSTDDSFEDDEYDEFTEEEDETVFGDYETVEDAARIRKNLKAKKAALSLRITFTAIIAAFMLFTLLPVMTDFSLYADVLAIASVALTVTAAILNFDIFKSFLSLFGKRTDADLSLALCTLFSVAYGIYAIATANYSLAQFGAIAVFGMLFSAISKKQNVTRILKNFECISNSDEKYALHLIDENSGSFTIAYDAIDGEALVACGKKTTNVLGFLKHSYSKNPFEHKGFVLSIIGAVICALMAIYCFVTLESAEAFGYTALMFAVASPFSTVLVSSLPLKLASRRLSQYGAMLAGYKTAEKIEPVNAVVLDSGSLFPRGTVKMFDMKILAANDLERTIFNAAAVTTSIGSPLGHVFRRIARTSDDYVLPAADSVKYEKRMGVSGWVGDESLLIGNRTLMETHGVSVPSAAVDKKILRSGYFPVYVASGGNPCALLIVGYENDRQITKELHRLCDMGVTLLINNCDPNITEEMIGDYFDLPNDFVKIMKSGSVKKYEECTETEESVDCGAAFLGGAPAIASIVTAAIKVKRLTSYMTVLHTLTYVIGLVGAALLIVLGNFTYLTPLFTLGYLVLSLITVYLAPLFYKP